MFSNYKHLSEKIGRSFPSFVDHVLQEASAKRCHDPKAADNCVLDLHWRPFYARCDYCSMDYDFIGRMESFDEDRAYVIRTQELEELYPLLEKGVRLNQISHASNRTTNYFKELNKEQKAKLLKLYDLDFQMFGYDPSLYL